MKNFILFSFLGLWVGVFVFGQQSLSQLTSPPYGEGRGEQPPAIRTLLEIILANLKQQKAGEIISEPAPTPLSPQPTPTTPLKQFDADIIIPTPAPPIDNNLVPTPAPTPTPIFDEIRDDDVLVQINNLRINNITLSPTANVKAYFYVSRDIGWRCFLYQSEDSVASTLCPLDVRRPILQKELVVRINNDTILLLRNRVRTDISQFNVGDKINVYGFLDKDNLTFDALVVRKIVGKVVKREPVSIDPIKPIAPIKPISLPVKPIPTTSLIRERWLIGYLEKIMPSSPAVIASPTFDSLITSTPSNVTNEVSHIFTTDNNLSYSVRAIDDNVKGLLDKYTNNRVRIYATVEIEAASNVLGRLIVKQIFLATPTPSLTPPKKEPTKEQLVSVSGMLTETGISIYMWGTHTLQADDNRTYLVKAVNDEVLESLRKNTGKRVTVYAKKIEYKDLEGGFWAIEAEKVIPLLERPFPSRR
ncbi:MAG: hypothetical protein NZ822_01400 [Patescibacteria group bacterium]|nr:hypothetical protein [Patescibacteria group bacterium]